MAAEGYTSLIKGKAVCVTKPFCRVFKLSNRFGSDKLKEDLTMPVNTGRIRTRESNSYKVKMQSGQDR